MEELMKLLGRWRPRRGPGPGCWCARCGLLTLLPPWCLPPAPAADPKEAHPWVRKLRVALGVLSSEVAAHAERGSPVAGYTPDARLATKFSDCHLSLQTMYLTCRGMRRTLGAYTSALHLRAQVAARWVGGRCGSHQATARAGSLARACRRACS